MRVVKGHGTQNDFVVVPDHDGSLDLDAATVRALCHRRSGLGGDGVLRVVRSAACGLDGDDAEWFMDYRNADGSVAEMCGNGVRVYARYLVAAGLVPPGALRLATRGGTKEVHVPAEGDVTVDMGPAVVGGQLEVAVGERRWPALAVDMGNPHAVAFVADLAEAGPLAEPPRTVPAGCFPAGVNVEFAERRGRGSLAMRVHERGVGETASCGTGACAVVVAARRAEPGSPGTWSVGVPGGELVVTEREGDGHLLLRGPAVLVGEMTLDGEWLAAVRRG